MKKREKRKALTGPDPCPHQPRPRWYPTPFHKHLVHLISRGLRKPPHSSAHLLFRLFIFPHKLTRGARSPAAQSAHGFLLMSLTVWDPRVEIAPVLGLFRSHAVSPCNPPEDRHLFFPWRISWALEHKYHRPAPLRHSTHQP
jgi:hypothetical protein